jgi:hypothetical protein
MKTEVLPPVGDRDWLTWAAIRERAAEGDWLAGYLEARLAPRRPPVVGPAETQGPATEEEEWFAWPCLREGGGA